MFAGITTLPQRIWLIGLLVIWALLLFGGMLWRRPQPGRAGRMPVQTRILSSAVLVLAGWSWALFSRGTAAASYAWLIAAGMTLGFIGDLFMAKLLPGSHPVIGGMMAFGLGHLGYIIAGWRLGSQLGLTAAGSRFGPWVVWLTIGVLGWYLIVARGHRLSVLRVVALPYVLLLVSTASIATGLTLQAATLWPFAVGAALFVLSDLILAAGLFRNRGLRRSDDLIWLTYGPAQMLIVYSIGSVLHLVK